MAETEFEKFKGLVEDVDYSDEESYREKLETLKESYFPSVKPNYDAVSETIDDVETGNAQSTLTQLIQCRHICLRLVGLLRNRRAK